MKIKKNKKFNTDLIVSKIDKFIDEGINITRQAQEGDAIYSTNNSSEFLGDIFKKYFFWNENIKKLLNIGEINNKIDIGILYQGNSVPSMRPSGIEYGDIQSEKSQELLKNIRTETNNRIEWLRQIKKELIEKTKPNEIEIEKPILKNDILYFQNKEIDFNNKQNQKDLLKILFTDRNKNWSYDEIQEKSDETGIDKEKYPDDFWRTFYSAGDDINKAVAIKTQVEDFIIKNTKEIRINPKYA